MKVYISVRQFSKNDMITIVTGYCSCSARPETMTMEAVRQCIFMQ